MLSQAEAKPPPMAPIVTSDYDQKKGPIVKEKKAPVVTSDYAQAKSINGKSYQKSKKHPAKPKIPGCEVRKYEAGWNVFRVWYDPKQPGEKWPKKHRAYEGYLTIADIEKEKEIKTNASKKTAKSIARR